MRLDSVAAAGGRGVQEDAADREFGWNCLDLANLDGSAARWIRCAANDPAEAHVADDFPFCAGGIGGAGGRGAVDTAVGLAAFGFFASRLPR